MGSVIIIGIIETVVLVGTWGLCTKIVEPCCGHYGRCEHCAHNTHCGHGEQHGQTWHCFWGHLNHGHDGHCGYYRHRGHHRHCGHWLL